MTTIQLYAVSKDTVYPLPVPPEATRFDGLYAGMTIGVYSTLRTYEHNKFLWLDEHIARLRLSMNLLGWSDDLDERALRKGLHMVLSLYPHDNARVRFDILAKPVSYPGGSSRMLLAVMPFTGMPEHLYTEGVRVGFAESLRRETPRAKSAAFVNQRRQFPIGTEDAYERLLLNEQGQILECTSANFYGLRGGSVLTAQEGILEGVTRKIILHLIKELKIPLVFEPVTVSEIDTLDEAALSSSSRAIIPIVQIGEQIVGNGRPGPIVQRLLNAYREFVAKEVKTAV